jgi:hypothetical protein
MPDQNNNGLQQNTVWLNKLIEDKRTEARAKKVVEAAHGVLIEHLSPERAVEAAVKHMIDQGYEVTKNRYLESGGYSVTFERYVGKTDGFQPGRFFLGRVLLIVTPAGNGVGCRVRTSGSSGAGRNELEHVHRWAGQHLNRSYKASKLPVFLSQPLSAREQEVLLKLYGEVCNSWRTLTDVRFKLLGLVPIVSGLFLIRLLSGDGLSPTVKAGIALFGLAVTFALWMYEVRNSELYDDLVSRGRRIETELGISTGHFRGRLNPLFRYMLGSLGLRVRIQHDSAINLIYTASVVGWLLALVTIVLGF